MLIQESFVNRTRGGRIGDSEPYKPFTDNLGELYKSLTKEYGRCTGKVRIDIPGDGSPAIGWMFEKRMRYEDARTNKPEDYYLREVWVTLYEKPDTVTREKHYLFI